MTDHIREFWDKQAEEHGQSDTATAPDHYYRDLEISRIMEHMRDGATVLDAGCGNGFSISRFIQRFPNSEFWGIDYSAPMIHAAQQLGLRKAHFSVVDIRVDPMHWILDGAPHRFDIIVSERCLINLANWEEQELAIRMLGELLMPRGRLILVENTIEGLENLNDLRGQFGLSPIGVRWHNQYLPQAKLDKLMLDHFVVERAQNIGCLYYILSRVVYAKWCADNEVMPDYNNWINEIASKLPSLHTFNYSPNMLYVARPRP